MLLHFAHPHTRVSIVHVPDVERDEIEQLHNVVRDVPAADNVVDYAARLVRATRPTGEEAPEFVRKWVPRPAVLTGRNICRESQWGRLLASYVAQLAPEFVVHAPLPQAVLIDQLGALLALTAAELSGSNIVSTPIERSVRDQVHDHIVQRCSETSLRAEDVASSLNVSTRTLHRVLAACGETFGAMLIQARVDLAQNSLREHG